MKQYELDKQIRRNWGEISPVTKVIPNKKKYNRKKDKNSFKKELTKE